MGCLLISAPTGPEVEDVDFDIEKESWNVYELVDGSTIRIRTVMFALRRNRSLAQGQVLYVGGFQNVFSVKAPQRVKGEPSGRIYSPEELEKLPRSEVAFSPLLEEWNIYKLKDGTRIKVKLIVTVVQRVTNVYDQFGDPMYIVSSSNVISPIPKKVVSRES